tara:strand:+ start:70 stop:318 length:249 start_codon:yes stop_codon:yes gene_type:complete
MRTFIDFVTEITRLDTPEADTELKKAVIGHLNKGEKISTFDGESPARMTYRTTTAADGLERKEKIKNSVSATINQGVAGGGY